MSLRIGATLTGMSMTAFIGALICIAVFARDSMECSRGVKRGNGIVRLVDVSCEREGKLPESLSEVGIPDTDQDRYFYQPCTDGQYIVWFGTRLGESMIYDSATRKWDPFNAVCNVGKATP